MSGNSYRNWGILSDTAIEKAVGNFIKVTRQRQNKTQAEVAKQANMSRSTLSLLERGENVNLSTLIKVLRVLDQLQVLNNFEVIERVSPIALAKEDRVKMRRVRKSKSSKIASPKSDW